MKTKILIAFFGFLVSLKGFNQKVSNDFLQNLIPDNFLFLDSTTCDFNKDGVTDLLLVVKSIYEDSTLEEARPLLIYKGNRKGGFSLFSRNDSVVLCKGCGGVFGDPYQRIVAKGSYFSVEHYGGSNWRWTRIITFRYNQNNSRFLLYRDGGISFHVSDPEKVKSYLNNEEQYAKLNFSNFRYE